ncbi:MAG: methionine--tRNA ligase [Patescibacteria group bacterium]|nr:methionine--tRNA ligase [Patescibacteria group bacterium]MDE2438843.1 methionine--tRNA ligase [Patescibacteria group bacterium]
MQKKFYITSAIPYVNAKPHIGHTLELVQADMIARYHRLQGDEVFYLFGTDENALKNVQAAEHAGIPPQEFVDIHARYFSDLAKKLNVKLDAFIKSSDPVHHFPASQKLWQRCYDAGDIYKRSYEGLYCVGCETFYARDELNEQGECLEHPGKALETVSEENYFFRLGRYQETLITLIKEDRLAIIPATRKNEILSFLTQPLQDISISRSNERAKNWGVPVPHDPTQRMYVWFDALNVYQSGIGFGWDETSYRKWWPADLHVIGKGITRFHAIYWPAFLLSAQLELPKALFVHGYMTVNGQKMSKTLGNVIDPFDLITRYGADPIRYYLLREIPAVGDGDFSEEKMNTRYTSDLAHGIGNLASRITTLAENTGTITLESFDTGIVDPYWHRYHEACVAFKFNEALEVTWELIAYIDRELTQKRLWATPTNATLSSLVSYLLHIAWMLNPFLPHTSETLLNALVGNSPVYGHDYTGSRLTIKKISLFPKREA